VSEPAGAKPFRASFERETAMLFITGIGLVVLAVAMLVIARPADGVSAPWLKSWTVGQVYALGALTSGVLGICFVLNGLPG
jgi:hypothetical protein